VRSVELSLLGGNPTTHDGIMRFPGAFERAVRAAELLREAGIEVTLKATLLRPNKAELPDMADLARRLGVRFAANISVAPRIDGDPSPVALALGEEDLADLDLRLIKGGLIPAEEHTRGALLTCQGRKAGLVLGAVLAREQHG